MMPIITKYLTPEDYGVSGVIMAYIAAFEAFKDLGLRVISTNAFFKSPIRYKYIWRKLFGVIQIWSFFYVIILSIILYLIIPKYASQNYIIIALLILTPLALFEPTISLGRDYFQFNKKPIPISIISVVSGLITILVNYLSIVIFKQGYLGLFISLFFSGLFNFIVYFIIVFFKIQLYPSFKFSIKWLVSKLKISFPTIPHYYAGFLLNISDRIILDFYKIPLKDIGLYSFAYSIGTYFSIIGKSYQQASGPYYMEFYKQNNLIGDNKSKKLSSMIQLVFIGLAFILSIWCKNIFEILVKNNELKNTYLIAIVIIFSYTYHPSNNFLVMKIWFKENTKKLLKISVVSAIISVLLNILLIPYLGYWGAVISTIISMLFMGYGGFLYKDINELFLVNYNWWIWLFLTTVLMLLALFIVDLTILYKIAISIFSIFAITIYILINKSNANSTYSIKIKKFFNYAI